MINIRKMLVSLLLKAEKQGYSNIILNSAFGENNIDDREKSFITAVFYGVLERLITIDYILDLYLKKPVKKAPPYTKAVLRSAVYQIVYMDKIPDSAAVNEAVKLVRNSKERGNAGLVNAVLRKVCRFNPDTELPHDNLSVVYSVNSWIAIKLCNYYGSERAVAFLNNSLNASQSYIHLNPLKNDCNNTVSILNDSGVILDKTILEYCYKAKNLKNIEALLKKTDNGFYVNGMASQLAVKALKAKPGDRVLDVCAAPGGKSFSAAIDMQNKGEIISCELYPQRAEIIEKSAKRLGIDIITSVCRDSSVYDESLGCFDKIICDVPCSGIGVIKSKPEIKYKSEEELSDLPDIQLKLLETAAKYLKIGGRLIYSTCTVLKDENEKIIEKFLKNNSGYKKVPLENGLTDECEITLLPPFDDTDGFYMAAIERM